MHKRAAALLLTMILVLAGCGTGGPILPSVTPLGSEPGYYAVDQVVTGGRSGTMANLASAKLEESEGTTTVEMTLTALDGAALRSVTPYIAWMQPTPDRLTVRFSNIDLWDWEDEAFAGNHLVYGAFAQYEADGTTVTMVFNLSAPCQYRVEESGGKLRIALSPEAVDPTDTTWHAILSSHLFAGLTVEDMMSMTLCSDGVTRAMISLPMANPDTAERYADGIRERFRLTSEDRELEVIELPVGALPPPPGYTPADHLVQRPMFQSIDGTLDHCDLIAADMRFLCWLGDDMLLAKPGSNDTETLWTVGSDGGIQQFLPYEIGYVFSAMSSPDGTMVALHELSGNTMALSVYDRIARTMTRTGEESSVLQFAWGNDDKLYYLSTIPEEESGEVPEGEEHEHASLTALFAFDPDASADDPAAARTELTRGEGYYNLGMLGGSIILSQYSEIAEEASLLAYDLSTGQVTPYATALQGLVSGDGRFIAVGESAEAGLWEGVSSQLSIHDDAGQAAVIYSGGWVQDVAWSHDDQALWWIAIEGDMDDFGGLKLWRWTASDRKSVLMGDVLHGMLMPGRSQDEIMINDSVEFGGVDYNASWRIRFASPMP